jgi:ADP-heptose:LPS heptosyltransferase
VALFLNACGDHLLTLPALRGLSSSVGGRLTLVVRRGFPAVFFRDVAADAVVEIDAAYGDGHYAFDAKKLAEQLRAMGPIAVLASLNPWHSRDVERLLESVRPDWSVGFGASFDLPLPLDFSKHSSELAFDVVRALAPDADIERWSFPVALTPDGAVTALAVRHAIDDRPLAVVHTDTKPEKSWPEESWREALEHWLRADPRRVAIDLGLGDRTSWLGREAGMGQWVSGLGLRLDQALAVVGLADRFFGIDSCFLHAADLARLPGVGIFGPTEPREFGFRWSPHRHVKADELAELDPRIVIDAIDGLEHETAKAGGVVVGRATEAGTSWYAETAPAGDGHFHLARSLRLGSVGLGTSGFRPEKAETATQALVAGLAGGCNVVDLAANHGAGAASVLVGQGLRRALAAGVVTRDSLFICSKAGFTEHLSPQERRRLHARGVLAHAPESSVEHDIGVTYLRWELDQQLRLLGLDTLDAFLLQNPEEARAIDRARFEEEIKSAFSVLEAAADAGRINMYGVSTAEAFRVPREDPLAIDLGELLGWAEEVGGPGHRFRVIELPVNPARLEGLTNRAHTLGGEAVTCLELASERGLIVLASAAINGGVGLEALAASVGTAGRELRDPGARVLQATRSLPGVTAALVGMSSGEHVEPLLSVVRRSPGHPDQEWWSPSPRAQSRAAHRS